MNLKIENRLNDIFRKPEGKLSIYITAGYPKLDDTVMLLEVLQDSGVDFIEIGVPFSDSIMDGPVILKSHETALANGMTIEILFEQLEKIREKVSIPLVLMGSMNPVYQYGFEKFCQQCRKVGIDGLLLPDLPLTDFKKEYQSFYEENNLASVFMISPHTNSERLHEIDEAGKGFLYAVSSNSTTGGISNIEDSKSYFKRLKSKEFKNPVIVGFNINTNNDVRFVNQYTSGAIVGSAFIKIIEQEINEEEINAFIKNLRK